MWAVASEQIGQPSARISVLVAPSHQIGAIFSLLDLRRSQDLSIRQYAGLQDAPIGGMSVDLGEIKE